MGAFVPSSFSSSSTVESGLCFWEKSPSYWTCTIWALSDDGGFSVHFKVWFLSSVWFLLSWIETVLQKYTTYQKQHTLLTPGTGSVQSTPLREWLPHPSHWCREFYDGNINRITKTEFFYLLQQNRLLPGHCTGSNNGMAFNWVVIWKLTKKGHTEKREKKIITLFIWSL